jgi:hypothetical protein
MWLRRILVKVSPSRSRTIYLAINGYSSVADDSSTVEPCIQGHNGSGSVFFSMCNLRYVFSLFYFFLAPPSRRRYLTVVAHILDL